jgi:transcriptional regulator with XRE-family HTH domain
MHSRIVAAGHKTVKSFAEKTGIHYSIVSDILNGKRYPGKVHLRAIAQGLHITMAEVEGLLDA